MEAIRVLFLLLLLPLALASSTSSLPSTNGTDRFWLLAFKNQITQDPSGTLSTWNETIHFCNWEGVSCSRKHPLRVVALDLSSRGLAGFISPSIANLTFLREIYLQNNSLYGQIPTTIGRLRRLQLLDLSFNSLNGGIPINITSCYGLRTLDLNGNTISGNIPPEVGNLRELEVLLLSKNSLRGEIPASLGNISTLHQLAFLTNHLEGSIPEELGRLRSLKIFQASDNRISGTVPSSLFNLSYLQYFGVAGNQLEGILPPSMGTTLPRLQTLLLGGNGFKGPLPSSLPKASQLSFIDMSINELSGEVPSDLGRLGSLSYLNLESNQLQTSDASSWEFITSLANCSQLQMLSLDDNKLSGELPGSIGNLSHQLRELRLNVNQIYGSIPSEIENLVNLFALALGPNLLTGVIPEGIGKLKRLQLLTLFKSRLGGSIPTSLGNLTQLTYLYLTGNNLEGPIPPSIGKLQNLQELGLSDNHLSGTIPKEILSLSSLTSYGLSYNSLVGSLPTEVGSLTYLTKFFVAGNKLSGTIPSTLGNCKFLQVLDVSDNSFQGAVPPSFEKLIGLNYLDLSQNNLSGPIPDFLANMRLASLNLSFNHLEGQVPTKGVFGNATEASVVGNDGLCGGIPEFHLPLCPLKSSKGKGQALLLKIVIPVGCMVLLCLLLFCSYIVLFVYKKRKSRKEALASPSLKDQYPRASYIELEKATSGFSSENLIGAGRHGSVYKGSMSHENLTVAVKVFNLQEQGASKSFIAECEALRNIRHRNLIKILTSCSSLDSKGNDFKALIFEYMPNGSLETWLHPEERGDQLKKLSLTQRLNIAIDVANALDYLHHDCQTPVVHCDLKPSNILLDNDMVAHVGDFGLARLLPESMSKLLQESSSSIGIMGSIGYLPPEYGAGGPISTFGDVYSYGILLLEMFTGRRPVNDMFRDGLSLYTFAEIAFPDRIMEIADPQLLLQGEDEEDGDSTDCGRSDGNSRKIQECISSVIRVSLSCSSQLPKERMNMRDVMAKMYAVRDTLLGSGVYGQQLIGDQLEGKHP